MHVNLRVCRHFPNNAALTGKKTGLHSLQHLGWARYTSVLCHLLSTVCVVACGSNLLGIMELKHALVFIVHTMLISQTYSTRTGWYALFLLLSFIHFLGGRSLFVWVSSLGTLGHGIYTYVQ